MSDSLDRHAASLPDGVTVYGAPGRNQPRRTAPLHRRRTLGSRVDILPWAVTATVIIGLIIILSNLDFI